MSDNEILNLNINYDDICKDVVELIKEYQYLDKFYVKSPTKYQAEHSRNLRKIRVKMSELMGIFEEYPTKIEKYNKSLPKPEKPKKTKTPPPKKIMNNNLKGGTNTTDTPNNNIFQKSSPNFNYDNNNDTLIGLTEIEPKPNKTNKTNKIILDFDDALKKLEEFNFDIEKKYNPNDIKIFKDKVKLFLKIIDNNFDKIDIEEYKIKFCIMKERYKKLRDCIKKEYNV